MKFYALFLSLIVAGLYGSTQTATNSTIRKPPIDSTAIANWTDLTGSYPTISRDGKFFMYNVKKSGKKSLVIQKINGNWIHESENIEGGHFSADNRQAYFLKNDTLFFYKLGRNEHKYLIGIASLKQPAEITGEWLAYTLKKENVLVLYNLVSGRTEKYENVKDFYFDNKARVLLLLMVNGKNEKSESLQWINLATGKKNLFWKTSENQQFLAGRFCFDEDAKQLVFLVQQKKENEAFNSVLLFKEGMSQAIIKVNYQTPGMEMGMFVSGTTPSFSQNGKQIFFKIEPKPDPVVKPNPNGIQVDVWNYKDPVLQERQLEELKKGNGRISEAPRELYAAIGVEKDSCIVLGKKGMESVFYSGPGDIVLLGHKQYSGYKSWHDGEKVRYYLLNLNDGSRKYIVERDKFNLGGQFHYQKNLFIYQNESDIISCNILTGNLKNIPDPIILSKYFGNSDIDFNLKIGLVFDGFIGNGGLIFYDEYDLWKVDPTGKIPPINLTNGYGRKNHIRFRTISQKKVSNGGPSFYSEKEPLLLTAFNEDNKGNGFYKLYIKKRNDPQLLHMGSYLYYAIIGQTPTDLSTMKPIKAQDADVWIVKRQTASEAPDYFATKDFKTFKRLTNYQPQKKYNWYSTELISWKLADGNQCQGILYKPDDFDPKKKYPVIVYYYEKESHRFNQYLRPDLIHGGIDIPWFVSRNYFVFVPDIHYKQGKAAECVVDAVVSGVRFISNLSYIDSTRIGAAGHSFGGYETNVLITHTNIFKAASEGAGSCNLISHSMQLLPGGNVSPHLEVGGQYRIGITPWEDLPTYINNSPIFKADVVSTPLLMMHNKKDGSVPWAQAVEFFLALRRLNKPVWMLQYDNGTHGVNSKDEMDYTIRMTQFFDHYLKEKPAPKWMTFGVPAKLKGFETGYELDSAGTCGKSCEVCNIWNRVYEKVSITTTKEVQKK